MATVTIAKPYFEALLRRFTEQSLLHDSQHNVDSHPNLSHHVTLSKAEHDYLTGSNEAYQHLSSPLRYDQSLTIPSSVNPSEPILTASDLLKSALFRGGLTHETLETLLADESNATTTSEAQQYDQPVEDTQPRTRFISSSSFDSSHHTDHSVTTDDTEIDHGYGGRLVGLHRLRDGLQRDKNDNTSTYEPAQTPTQRIPLHDQRTLLISNLPERTTHKDLTGIIRGGRLLDIFLRNDRTATISFVEGAADFLAYAKRTDIYLHMKRLEVRWADRQFHVPSHVSNKIANGATRNLVVRSAAGKLTAAQIRDHLDHIHNLVVVDIVFGNGDAFISTNSIHNALFARTCMMSRTSYKGLRIEYTADECAGPTLYPKPHVAPTPAVSKPEPTTNTYAVLDLDTSLDDSSSEDDSYLTEGVRVDHYHWADATAA